jgi:PmbA protein
VAIDVVAVAGDPGGDRAAARRRVSRFDDLAGALRRAPAAAEWVAAARTRVVGAVGHGADEGRRVDRRTELTATVFRDLPAGRGAAQVAIPGSAPIGEAVTAALAQASSAVGPAWSMVAPAAPAQVDVDDPALAVGEADDAAEAIATEVYAAVRDRRAAALAGGPLEVVSIAIEVVRDDLELSTSQGLHAAWSATEARVTALLAAGGRTTIAEARARRHDGLELAVAIPEAAERLGALPAAAPPPAGSYAVVLRLAALAPLAGRGLLDVFAAQADAALVRQGLSRWRPGQAVVEDATADPEPLTIVSDGTLPYGLRSAPVGDQGEPVRRFTLVERGIARDLAFDQREAALAGARPNGGVRNLAVAPGATPAAELAAGGPVLDVAELAWIDLDPRTGAFTADIGFGWLRDGGAATPVRGAILRGDAVALLAHARRSREVARRGSYHGPVAVRLPPIAVS